MWFFKHVINKRSGDGYSELIICFSGVINQREDNPSLSRVQGSMCRSDRTGWWRKDSLHLRGSRRKRRGARTVELKDTSCLYILSLVQISALERASGNKSADSECVNGNQQHARVCDSWGRSSRPFITIVPDTL